MAQSIRTPIDVKPKWSAVLALCKKCDDGDSELPDRVKARAKERELRDIRVLRSSCLDVCPKDGVCAAYIGADGTKTAVFDTNADADVVIDYLCPRR